MTKKQNRRRTRPRTVPTQRTVRASLGPWPGPVDTRIRAAGPGEGPRINDLLASAGTYLEAHHVLDAGQFGTLVQTGLARGVDAMFADVQNALASRDLDRLFHGMTTVLVAEDHAGTLVGTVVVLPPGKVMAPLFDAGAWDQALRLLLTVAKVRGIAVDETVRGSGIGTALLDQAVSLHVQRGAALAYGQFSVEEELEAFYRARGFDVLDPGATLQLNPLGVGATVHSYPHERLFTRWLL